MVRNDFLDIMMELRKRGKKDAQENMIAEQNPDMEPRVSKFLTS
jgi:hypothetical protein